MKRRMIHLTGLAPLLLATAVGLLVASCSQDDAQLGDAPSGEPVALALPALYTADVPSTRSATTFPTDGSAGGIGFFVKPDAPKGYAAIYNQAGIYDTELSLWCPTPDSIWLNNHDADVAVYAPYDAAQSTTTGTLALTAGIYIAAKDLSLHRMAVSSRTMKDLANPVLDHLYSRLTVTFVKDEHYAPVAKVASVTVSGGDDLYATATYNPFADTDANPYTYTGTGFTVSPATPPTLGTDPDATDAATVDMLLIPSTYTGSVTALLKDVTLTVVMADGVKLQVDLPKTSFDQSMLAPGMQHKVKLTLISGKLELNGIHTMNWDSQTPVNGGGLIPTITHIPTEPTATIGGLEWSAYNCNGTGGVVTKPWEYGAYYQFYEASDGIDNTRCPADYRLPTKDELLKLVASKAPAGIAIKINGKKYTTNSFGFIGKDADPYSGLVVIEGANILFLPAAGYRSSEDYSSMLDVGTHGKYWSCTNYGSTGWGLGFNSSSCDKQDLVRGKGLSVRCVKQ